MKRARYTGSPNLADGYLNCRECGEVMRPKTMGEEWPTMLGDKRFCETTTLVGFGSPAGHNHDNNCWCRLYVCSNNHEVKIGRRMECDTCDWKGMERCGCHDYDKLNDWPRDPAIVEYRHNPNLDEVLASK